MINEIGNTPEGQFMLGRLQGRQNQRARGEQTSGRIKQTTKRADDYWRGTDFNDGENFEDSQSWADSYDDYDQYGDFDSEAYERNQQERERDQERQSELYSRVQNKLSKKAKNENKNMSKKNTMKKQLNERIEPKHLEFLEEFIAGSYMDIAAGRKTFKDAFNDFLNFVKAPFTPAELKKLQAKGRKILLQAEKEQDELFDEIGGFDSVDYRQNYYENKKRTVKLTESKLKNIITESVREALRDIL